MNGAQATLKIEPLYAVDARFLPVVNDVIGIEGGHSNDRDDHGGESNYGVSLRFLVLEGAIDRNHDGFKDFDLDMDGDIDGADIRKLTPDLARDLYYRCFWRRFDLGNLPKHIDSAVFDQAVNCGGVAAIKMLQRALNDMKLTTAVLRVDGDFGNQSKARIGMAMRQFGGVDRLLAAYRLEARAHYLAIIAEDPTQAKYRRGWLKRAERLGHV